MSIVPLRTMDNLTIAASRLERAAPGLWKDFREAFSALNLERAEQCIQAPSDKILVAQGRAQQVFELQTLFTNAVAQASRLEANMKEKSRGNQ